MKNNARNPLNLRDQWVTQITGDFTDFNTKVLKSEGFGFLDFFKKSKEIQGDGYRGSRSEIPRMLISLRNQLRDRNHKIMKFNTKVLNFIDFVFLERFARIERFLQMLG